MRLAHFPTVAVTVAAITVALAISPSFIQAQAPIRARALNAKAPAASITRSDPSLKLVLDNPDARVLFADLAAQATVRVSGRRGDYLLVSLGPSRFELATGPTHYSLELQDGEMQVLKGGWAHEIINKSNDAIRVLEIDISRGIEPEHAVCGLGGASCSGMRFGKTDQGSYTESVLFETPSIRALKAELGPGGVLKTHDDRREHFIVPLRTAQMEIEGNAAAHELGKAYKYSSLNEVTNRGGESAQFIIVELK